MRVMRTHPYCGKTVTAPMFVPNISKTSQIAPLSKVNLRINTLGLCGRGDTDVGSRHAHIRGAVWFRRRHPELCDVHDRCCRTRSHGAVDILETARCLVKLEPAF